MRYLKLILVTLASFISVLSFAQTLDTALVPFYHGVASGDPLTDRVIIWTRVTTQQTGPVTVKWWMATDTTFRTIVGADSTTTDSTRDYTVKVDVTGLQADTWYYYRFQAFGKYSLTGRTKTLPDGNVDHVRLSIFSCSDYQNGYFTAFQSMVQRNDIDALVHIGDYIYEYGPPGGDTNRLHIPPHDVVSLSDYRTRYSQYHLDPQLAASHQQYAWISIWDDHEFANNAWVGGAQNHDSTTQGPWAARVANAKEAYFEWIPIREHAQPDTFQIYRNKYYGNLADMILLDTRIEGRTEQTSDTNIIYHDSTHVIMSPIQFDWMSGLLHDTTAQWKIIAQQVMMGPLVIGGTILDNDQWDGYYLQRLKLYNTILNDSINDVAVLSGDIHSFWANNLQRYGLTGDTVCAEFVSSSITSQGFQGDPIVTPSVIYTNLPGTKYVDLQYHGYCVLDITPARIQSDYYIVSTIDTTIATTSLDASWYENHNERFLRQGTASAPYSTPLPTLAPAQVQSLAAGINGPTEQQQIVMLGVYPNPTTGYMMLQYYQANDESLSAKVYDMSGKLQYEKVLPGLNGVNLSSVSLDQLGNGSYLLVLTDGQNTYHKMISVAR